MASELAKAAVTYVCGMHPALAVVVFAAVLAIGPLIYRMGR